MRLSTKLRKIRTTQFNRLLHRKYELEHKVFTLAGKKRKLLNSLKNLSLAPSSDEFDSLEHKITYQRKKSQIKNKIIRINNVTNFIKGNLLPETELFLKHNETPDVILSANYVTGMAKTEKLKKKDGVTVKNIQNYVANDKQLLKVQYKAHKLRLKHYHFFELLKKRRYNPTNYTLERMVDNYVTKNKDMQQILSKAEPLLKKKKGRSFRCLDNHSQETFDLIFSYHKDYNKEILTKYESRISTLEDRCQRLEQQKSSLKNVMLSACNYIKNSRLYQKIFRK